MSQAPPIPDVDVETLRCEIRNEYAFEVDRDANKIEIKRAIEDQFNVKVSSVRTVRIRGKMKRMGAHQGRRPTWKKAVVNLAEGNTIDVYEQI